jgi:hypothetical protein
MAWRIEKHVLRGEIDNREKGRVTGRIWLSGRDGPLALELQGNAWRDLAGHVLRFTNPRPATPFDDDAGFAAQQIGVVGDITASRKVRVPTCTDEELTAHIRAKTKFPWQWGNSLYLEWFSETNGRVVIEAAHYQLDLDPERAWEMTVTEEEDQRRANGEAIMNFMGRLTRFVELSRALDDEDDEPRSAAEAEADAESARMNQLLDRVQARMEREGEEADFERILDEERERLRRERDEPEPEPLTPEEEAERAEWIEEMNAAANEALEDAKTDDWKDSNRAERHPLVTACSDLGVRLHHEIAAAGWVDEHASEEHPLSMVEYGVMFASAKLAGALGICDEDEWPPDPLFAGDVLVRLKKAREHLRDAISGLGGADEQDLATEPWRKAARAEIEDILVQVQRLIEEVREALE